MNKFTTNEYVLEAVSSMAIMINEDPDIACESEANADGVMSRFKTRVSGIVKKIKEFIQKIIAWIKGKFLNLLKRDSITMDQELWLNATNAIKELDKGVKLGFTETINLAVFAAKHKSDVYDDDTQKMADKMKNMAASMKEKLDSVVEGSYYKNAMDGKTNGKKVTVSTSSLASLKSKFTKEIETLNTACNDVEKAMNGTNPDSYSNYLKGLSAWMEMSNVKISAINKAVSLINVIISSGERKNESEKVNKKL